MKKKTPNAIEIEGLACIKELMHRIWRLEITLAFLVGLNILQVGAQFAAWIKP